MVVGIEAWWGSSGNPRRLAEQGEVVKSQKLRDYLPAGEALRPKQLERWLRSSDSQSPVTYRPVGSSSEKPAGMPVLPFQVFAVTYEEDIVLETDHPRWSMHEYARVRVGERELWLAKDSDADGTQTITADLDEIETWIPEVPVPRRRGVVDVRDESTPERLKVFLSYRNPAGEKVEVDFLAPRPIPENLGSNGSTFNHSAAFVSPLLDISRKGLGGVEAAISYDGKAFPIRKVLGLIPVKAVLEQTQAGFAIASFVQQSQADGERGTLVRPIPGESWNTRTREPEALVAKNQVLRWETPTHRFEYALQDGGVSGVRAWQRSTPHTEAPHLEIRMSAALPDFRRGFSGSVLRHFAVLVNGKTQGYGRMIAQQAESGESILQILPVAPRWFAERPLESRIRPVPGATQVEVRTRRLPSGLDTR